MSQERLNGKKQNGDRCLSKENHLSFANIPATRNNPIQKILYICGYYVALLFKQIGVTPNQLTFLSLLFAIASAFLLFYESFIGFVFFWGGSHILDYADGTLARMTKNVRKTSLRLDHTSDLLKFIIVNCGIGLFYDSSSIWTMIFLSTTGFLFYTIINHELSEIINNLTTPNRPSLLDKSNRFIANVITVFFTINGHTFLVLFFIPVSEEIAYLILSYLILLVTFQSIMRIRRLYNIPRLD